MLLSWESSCCRLNVEDIFLLEIMEFLLLPLLFLHNGANTAIQTATTWLVLHCCVTSKEYIFNLFSFSKPLCLAAIQKLAVADPHVSPHSWNLPDFMCCMSHFDIHLNLHPFSPYPKFLIYRNPYPKPRVVYLHTNRCEVLFFQQIPLGCLRLAYADTCIWFENEWMTSRGGQRESRKCNMKMDVLRWTQELKRCEPEPWHNDHMNCAAIKSGAEGQREGERE